MIKNKVKSKAIHHINNKKVKKMRFRLFSFFFVILAIILLYLIYITSYCINIDGITLDNCYSVFINRFIHPLPFQFTFSIYSLIWVLVYLLMYCLWLSNNLKPKSDTEWEGIEQGSSHFMDDQELNEFLDTKSDSIKEIPDNEISLVENYIKLYNEKNKPKENMR